MHCIIVFVLACCGHQPWHLSFYSAGKLIYNSWACGFAFVLILTLVGISSPNWPEILGMPCKRLNCPTFFQNHWRVVYFRMGRIRIAKNTCFNPRPQPWQLWTTWYPALMNICPAAPIQFRRMRQMLREGRFNWSSLISGRCWCWEILLKGRLCFIGKIRQLSRQAV